MSERERLIRSIETDKGVTVEVKVDYRTGGMNYFQGVSQQRGYYLSVSPVKISRSECGRYSTRSYTAFSGVCKLLETATRFNKSKLDNIEPRKDLIDPIVSHVMSKNNLKVYKVEV